MPRGKITAFEILRAPSTRPSPLGLQVSKDQMEALRLSHDEFHDDWNYTLSARGIV